MKLLKPLLITAALASLSACTTMTPNTIKEVTEREVKGCKLLGPVQGSDAVFVGLSASVGSKNAKAKAMNGAVELNATHVVWSQQGTTMTNEWIGKAYRCK